MIFLGLCFAAGCAAGAFMTIWPIMALSLLALVGGMSAGFLNFADWRWIAFYIAFPMISFQVGFAVVVVSRGLFEMGRPKQKAAEPHRRSDPSMHAPSDIRSARVNDAR